MLDVIGDWRKSRGVLHFTLIDPENQDPEAASELAAKSEAAGSDAIMVGGSTAGFELTDATVVAIKKSSDLPVILFPGGSNGFSPKADYIFFMSLLNSMQRRFLVEEQVKAALAVKKSGIGVIPMGYILISTSLAPTTVEMVSKPDKIGQDDVGKAVAYAVTAELFGMDCVYLEAGSGAEMPVSDQMISQVARSLDIPLIVGGGIRDVDSAIRVVRAGADAIVTGTIGERDTSLHEDIIKAVKSG